MAHIVSAMLAPTEETPSKQEEDPQALKEHMMVQERQDKLLEKLNLDGLSEWTPPQCRYCQGASALVS